MMGVKQKKEETLPVSSFFKQLLSMFLTIRTFLRVFVPVAFLNVRRNHFPLDE